MTECACPVTDGDNQPSCSREETHKARKPYTCCECGGAIAIGDQYEYTWGVWEDGPDTYRTCIVCAEIRHGIFCDGWTYGSMRDDLREFIRECYPEAPWSTIGELSQVAQDVVMGMVEKVWGDHDRDKRKEQ